ncbi:flagellar motor switch protein FliN [Pistricoccus aurantiacus]|uniref:Flagellar motor switch protein FliN n=1 Tax=Pistricoccus aurantiacus TaxID=1883414 RepID=A0A5B8SXY7_9GAMM|nr:flagellar motor switch protein FliN [Pistricoccus aurantiacus]QEA39698.1 flagellar motor switch protein FliN [Pistricoccus aurantiacus]
MSDNPNDQPLGDKDTPDEVDTTKDDAEDIWAAALEEQQQQEKAPASDASSSKETGAQPRADDRVFKPLQGGGEQTAVRDLEMIMNIPVKLSVELGRTRITIKQLLELTKGSVIELDGLAGEPMDILINGYLIARGEVVVVEDKYGIRIAEIITPTERVQKLNR